MTTRNRSRIPQRALWLPATVLTLLAACGSGSPVTPPAANGQLVVNVSGLPAGANADIHVTGPSSYDKPVAGTMTLTALPAGQYTVTAKSVSANNGQYDPTPTAQDYTVGAGVTTAFVTYAAPAAPPGTLNLTIDKVYLTQSVQTLNNTVPLVKGRNGLLRVFVNANQTNVAAPQVRVRLYTTPVVLAAPFKTYMIPAPGLSVPTTTDESNLTNSWNVAIPASDIGNSLHILVDVDPGNTVPEGSETDNLWPVNGTPAAQDVRAVQPLNIKFVPITQNGTTGSVSGSTVASDTVLLKELHPVPGITTSIRGAITMNTVLQPSGSANNWSEALDTLEQFRVADGFTGHYYGLVHVTYQSGIAGLGYIGAVSASPGVPAGSSAMGWDDPGTRARVMAHEVGHNFNRFHTACPGTTPAAGSIDNSYPHTGGDIGAYGFKIDSAKQVPTTFKDIMSYCQPNQWISDYTYANELTYRATSPMVVTSSGSTVQPVLFVNGTIGASGVSIGPAYQLTTRPAMPVSSGPYAVEGFDANGRQLFSVRFAPAQIADLPDGLAQNQHFTFAIPAGTANVSQLASLRVRGPAGQAVRSSKRALAFSTAPAPNAQPAVQAVGTNAVSLSWDAVTYPTAIVRDPATGETLGFGSGGRIQVNSAARQLELVVSDGVQSHTVPATVPGR